VADHDEKVHAPKVSVEVTGEPDDVTGEPVAEAGKPSATSLKSLT